MAKKRKNDATRPSSLATTKSKPADTLVIYVHGVGQSDLPEELKLQWDIALFGSDQGLATRMAYWADLSRPELRSRGGIGKTRTSGGKSREEGAYATALEERFGLHVKRGRRAGAPRAKVLPLPPWLRDPIAEAFIRSFIDDSSAYFFKPGMRAEIQARFAETLPTDGTPVTVVAHSQGTIVAFEALAKAADVNVVRFVTLGSPLGLDEVQGRLEIWNPKKRLPIVVPRCIERWHNFADRLDPVALDRTLRGEFVDESGDPSIVTDDLVVNERTGRVFGFNPHSAIGYLAHPKVRASVCEAAQRDVMARFVVARDVAERLAVPEVRQPVLIEALEPGYAAIGESPEDLAHAERAETHKINRGARQITLDSRVRQIEKSLEGIIAECVGPKAVKGARKAARKAAIKTARIDPLRRFVAARLTPAEIRQLAARHAELRVYRVWRSSPKRKLLYRSHAPIQADAARQSYAADGRDTVWAVLDTGVRTDHPHFRHGGDPTILAVWDCTVKGQPKRLEQDLDRDGHGSHVAGIIAGRSATHSGIAPRAKLVVYKVLDQNGEGEDAWIIKALDHIAAQNENVMGQAVHGINLSLGGGYDSTVYGCGFSPICQELRRQWCSGVVVVVASGNEGQLEVQTGDGEVEINAAMSIGDPANLEDCIAVGSVNADKPHLYGISAFSSRGPTSDGRMKPDVVAPGERIRSVNARRLSGDGAYRVESGTSMAAPHVSGLLAAFLSVRREFRGRPDEVKRLLLATCTDLKRDRYHQGHGMPNLMRMLMSV